MNKFILNAYVINIFVGYDQPGTPSHLRNSNTNKLKSEIELRPIKYGRTLRTEVPVPFHDITTCLFAKLSRCLRSMYVSWNKISICFKLIRPIWKFAIASFLTSTFVCPGAFCFAYLHEHSYHQAISPGPRNQMRQKSIFIFLNPFRRDDRRISHYTVGM